MLLAVASDFARLPDVEVRTVWDRSLGACPLRGVEVVPGEPRSFRETATELLADSDAAFVIAPESDRILAEHCQLVARSTARWLGCSLDAIELCADKLRLAEVLEQAGVPTVPTSVPSELERWPIVLKPRFGAGCEDTFVVESESEFARVLAENEAADFVQQPYVGTSSFSVAVIASRRNRTVLPPVQQRIHRANGQLSYAGGSLALPSTGLVSDEAVAAILNAAGLDCGWVGIDFVISPDGTPLVVDINPRLTTSYAAYRHATNTNLAGMLLEPGTEPVNWQPGTFDFDKSGNVNP